MKYVGNDLIQLHTSGLDKKTFISLEIDGVVTYRQRVFVRRIDYEIREFGPRYVRAEIETTGEPEMIIEEPEGRKFRREFQALTAK